MGTLGRRLIDAFETHDVAEVAAVLEEGLDASEPIDGKRPVDWLTEMYYRSDRLGACLALLLGRGGEVADEGLRLVWMDDAAGLCEAIGRDAGLLARRYDVVGCFTPLRGATLLHVAAEYGNAAAARVLIEAGADVEARADVDALGFDGQTPVFHVVNSLFNRGAAILRMLLDAGARTDVRLPGLTWGRGFAWETTLLDVTPMNYCQMGLLPQMHRKEEHIYGNLRMMLEASGRSVPAFGNVPNRYLMPRARGV